MFCQEHQKTPIGDCVVEQACLCGASIIVNNMIGDLESTVWVKRRTTASAAPLLSQAICKVTSDTYLVRL
jgi:hypothetical protein